MTALETHFETEISDWAGLPSSTVSDCMNRFQAMDPGIRAMCGTSILGRAWTVRTMSGENATVAAALESAPLGSVLVIDGEGNLRRAIWGEGKTAHAQRRGIAGVVIDGAFRDIDAIRRRGFPVFARGVSPAGPHKGWRGTVGETIQCGSVVVNAGDIIIGDLDGVVVVPHAIEAEVLAAALAFDKEDKAKIAAEDALPRATTGISW